MSTAKLPEIQKLKFSALTINNLYSGRTEKEINENAKDKQKELAAFGGWNPAMPGQYFIGEDNAKHLVAGFSRVKASQLNNEDHGYFVEVSGDEIDHLLACETTNSTRPLSPLARGARYSELVDGVIASDFAEKNDPDAKPDKKNPEHWDRMPLTNEDIANRIGKSSEWVRKCIAIFSAPPEIRDMLECGKLATKVVEQAKSLADKYHKGSEAKQVAICRRAFAHARSEDKDTATAKHFDAIKAEFIPEKKLVAAVATVNGTPVDDVNKPAKATNEESKGDGAPEDETLPPETQADAETETLFQKAESELLEEGTKKNKKLIGALSTFFSDNDALEKLGVTMSLTLDECEILADEVVKIVANAREVF